jgi:hypothetical protein
MLLLLSCNNNIEYKYRVLGKVGKINSVWYTDTLFFKEDTAYYYNSDNSLVKIAPPYKINKIK